MFTEMLAADDPTTTPEITSFEVMRATLQSPRPAMVPPAFIWYWHMGHRDLWDEPGNGDPARPRPFGEYVDEAIEQGWWKYVTPLGPDTPPRVLIECGGNIVRRTRGGSNTVLEHLWPKLDLVVTIDFRMSATALWSDIVLPAAQFYEKVGLDMPTYYFTMTDEAVPPAGEAKPEWEMFRLLCEAIARRAAARGLDTFAHPVGTGPATRLPARFTLDERGAPTCRDDEITRPPPTPGSAPAPTCPRSASTANAVHGLGSRLHGLSHACPCPAEDEIANPREHVLEGGAVPTLTDGPVPIDHWFAGRPGRPARPQGHPHDGR